MEYKELSRKFGEGRRGMSLCGQKRSVHLEVWRMTKMGGSEKVH